MVRYTMKIFITGGTGFIGTPLVKKLESEENEILLLIHESEDKSLSNISKKIRTISGNLSNINSWKEEVNNFKPDAVIHMAWEGLPNYDSETSIKNLKYGLNLIKMLAQIGCKLFMSTGSCWEYGQQTGELKEDDTLKPFSAFSAAKNCLHWSGREIAQENDMVFVWTRLFYVYGPGQKENSLIPYIIKCIKKKKETRN